VIGVDPRLDDVLDNALRAEAAQWQRSRQGCPDPDLLMVSDSELLEGDVRAALDAHLRECAACARLSADLAALRHEAPDAASEAAVLARIRAAESSTSWWRLPLAAAILLGCGTGIWWMSRSPTPSSVPAQATSPLPPSTAGPIALWSIEPLPVTVPLTSVGATRSAGTNDVAAALANALTAYQAGRYEEGIPALRAVANAHPESADASLYLGVSLLLAHRPQDALGPLAHARQVAEPKRSPDIDWYLAAAEQRRGATAAARERLQALCAGPGDYQQRACAAERALR
jgi:predicted Zn-dependent protease